MLAGDHLKSASDLGVPLVGVGLFYREGYFRQGARRVRLAGRALPDQRPGAAAADARRSRDGPRPDLDGEDVTVRIWRADVGAHAPLPPRHGRRGQLRPRPRHHGTLYGGDHEHAPPAGDRARHRRRARPAARSGIEPTVFHMNEGHSAFLALERIRALLVSNEPRPFDEARRAGHGDNVFTTHTPVPAGNERLRRRSWCAATSAPTSSARRRRGEDSSGSGARTGTSTASASMAVLAMRLSAYANGVSALHGAVSREMWRDVWPERDPAEVPIGSITNGVHAPTWVGARARGTTSARGARAASRRPGRRAAGPRRASLCATRSCGSSTPGRERELVDESRRRRLRGGSSRRRPSGSTPTR